MSNPVALATRLLLRRQLTYAVWFWTIAVVAMVVVTAVLATFGVTGVSVVSFARQANIWFPFSMQIVTATTYLRVHVASGMTRRTFAWAALSSAATVALVNALLMTTLLGAERSVHSALGWGWTFQDGGLDPSGRSWPLMLADYGLTFLIATLCGLLAGIAFYAGGTRWGTLTLPLTVGPVLAVLALVYTSQAAWHTSAVAPGTGWVVATGAALAVAMATTFTLIARRTAVAQRP